jgi:CHAD domain-containing protein
VLGGRLPAPAAPRPEPVRAGDGGKSKKRKKGDEGTAARTAGEVVLGAVARQLQALRDADLAVRTEQPEGVHDLRVACRRLRSILAAFRSVLDREHTDPLREELRWVGAQLSGARDTEVALSHLRELVAAQPVELVLGPVAARLQQTQIKDHQTGARGVTRTLTDRRYLQLLDALDALLADPPVTELAVEPAPAQLADAVRRTGKRLRRTRRRGPRGRGRRAAPPAARRAQGRQAGAVHRGGRRGRVRRPATALVECVKQVQDLLGAAQDTVVTRDVAVRVGAIRVRRGRERLDLRPAARSRGGPGRRGRGGVLDTGAGSLRRAVKAVASLG